MKPSILVLASVGLLLAATVATATEVDWVPPRLVQSGVVFIPKGYYSSENDFGAGLEAVRPFRFPGAPEGSEDSEWRAKARYNLDGHGRAEFRATLSLGEGRWSVRTRAGYDALALRYWGVGSDTPAEAEEVYRPQTLSAYVEILRRIAPHLRAGLRGEFEDHRYLEIEEGRGLDQEGYRTGEGQNLLGYGLVAEWDTRDDRYAPTRGLWLQGFGLFFTNNGSNDYEFTNWYLEARQFITVAPRTVLALQGFGYSLLGDPPLWRFAALGGRAHSRGYRRGRYLERRMLAFQAELRRPIYWRVDGVAFAGLANVAGRFNDIQLETMRPTIGGGLRLVLHRKRNVVLRADLAFGEDSVRSYFSIGHAF